MLNNQITNAKMQYINNIISTNINGVEKVLNNISCHLNTILISKSSYVTFSTDQR